MAASVPRATPAILRFQALLLIHSRDFGQPLIYNIIKYLSPYDLVQIRRTCYAAKAAVDSNENVWIIARARLEGLPAPPIVLASGNWSESAYANLLFGSGNCAVCKEICAGLPACFALAFRCCSARCKERIQLQNRVLRLTHWSALFMSLANDLDTINFNDWLPSCCTTQPGIFVLPTAVKASRREIEQAKSVERGFDIGDRPRFVKRTTGELSEELKKREKSWCTLVEKDRELVEWAKDYEASRSTVETANIQCVQQYAALHNIPVTEFLRTGTVRRLISAFSRDLTMIDSNALCSIQEKATKEVKMWATHLRSFANGPLPASGTSQAQRHANRIFCPPCQATFSDRTAFIGHWTKRSLKVHLVQEAKTLHARGNVGALYNEVRFCLSSFVVPVA
ncbi:hypothetical protein B0H11DRAFT_2257757 [Mycena galericulata]|nr:hypothetical protein B0H11DRAFT_2257757 [Mycena galericulata]